MNILIFFVSFLPGLFYLWLVWRLDKYEPEPLKWIIFIFFLGIITVFPSVFFEELVNLFIFPYREASLHADRMGVILSSFFIIGPLEEFFKMLPVLAISRRKNLFDEPMDGLVYSAASSLGFASLENAMYCITFGSNIYILRAILTVPAHILFATPWAWGIGISTFKVKGFKGVIILLFCYILSIVFHGLYNFLILSKKIGLEVALLPLIIVMILLTIGAFYHFRKISPFRWSILPPGFRTIQKLSAQATFEKGLSIGWTVISTLIYSFLTALFFVIWGVLRISYLHGKFEPAQLITSHISAKPLEMAVLGVLLGVCYSISGIVIGRISRRITVFEPAIGAIVTLSLFFVAIAPSTRTEGVLLFLFLCPLFFILGFTGGLIGEAWQRKKKEI